MPSWGYPVTAASNWSCCNSCNHCNPVQYRPSFACFEIIQPPHLLPDQTWIRLDHNTTVLHTSYLALLRHLFQLRARNQALSPCVSSAPSSDSPASGTPQTLCAPAQPHTTSTPRSPPPTTGLHKLKKKRVGMKESQTLETLNPITFKREKGKTPQHQGFPRDSST